MNPWMVAIIWNISATIRRRTRPSSSTRSKQPVAPLGVAVVQKGPSIYGLELCAKDGKASLCVYQTEVTPTPLHLAFTAENRRQVEAFYRAAMEAGGKDNGAPGLCPEYHANYYPAFAIGPDGHNIEAVCHGPRPNLL